MDDPDEENSIKILSSVEYLPIYFLTFLAHAIKIANLFINFS